MSGIYHIIYTVMKYMIGSGFQRKYMNEYGFQIYFKYVNGGVLRISAVRLYPKVQDETPRGVYIHYKELELVI
jgi:hypothetical protein